MPAAKSLSEVSEPAPLAEWIPVVVWGALIFALSTSAFSAANTARIIDPMLRWLLPTITAPAVEVCHMLIRKAAHFTEYGVLFWLLVRGPMAQRPYLAFTGDLKIPADMKNLRAFFGRVERISSVIEEPAG